MDDYVQIMHELKKALQNIRFGKIRFIKKVDKMCWRRIWKLVY